MFASLRGVGRPVGALASTGPSMLSGRVLGFRRRLGQHLGVGKDLARPTYRKGRLPARKVGSLWRFKLSGVDDWVASAGPRGPNQSRKPAVSGWAGIICLAT